jgi:hypothetical protein
MVEMHIIITSKITIGQVIFVQLWIIFSDLWSYELKYRFIAKVCIQTLSSREEMLCIYYKYEILLCSLEYFFVFDNITSSVQKCYKKYVKLFTGFLRVCRHLCNAQWESTASTEVIEILLLWILCNSYMIAKTHFRPRYLISFDFSIDMQQSIVNATNYTVQSSRNGGVCQVVSYVPKWS